MHTIKTYYHKLQQLITYGITMYKQQLDFQKLINPRENIQILPVELFILLLIN